MTGQLLDNYAYLLLPADPRHRVRVIESADWSTAIDPNDADVVMWGRPPLRRPPGAWSLLRYVAARERALRKLAGSSRFCLRLAPPPGRNRATRLRTWLLGGALLEVMKEKGVRSRLDLILASSGAQPVAETFATGSDRAGTMRVKLGGRDGILRAAPLESPARPTAGAEVLSLLETANTELAPRVLAAGEVGDLSYVVESVVTGRRPRRLTDDLISEIASYLATLPVEAGPPTSPREDIEAVAIAMPRYADDLLEVLDRLSPHMKDLRAVVTHRDMWAGNVFVDGGHLSGIIDWDAAHLRGVPGVDLVQLFMSQHRERRRVDVGRAWLEKLWRTERFNSVTRSYWRTLGLSPTQVMLDAIAIAWWAGWLHQAVTRHERLLDDEQWLAANVSSVIAEAKTLL